MDRIIECTTSQSPSGVYMRQIEAERAFLRANAVGRTCLAHVTDKYGKHHLLWFNENGEQKMFLAVFIEDMDISQISVDQIRPAQTTDFIYRDECAYLLHQYKNGRFNVRLVVRYLSQTLVNALLQAQNQVPKQVYPVRVVNIHTGHVFGVCWRIIATKKDGDTEREAYEVLPVDLLHTEWLHKVDINWLHFEAIKVGENIEVDGVYYTLRQNEQGLYSLRRSHIQVLKRRK